jgi:hypothetical protein
VKYLKQYDDYPRRLAERGTQTTGLGSVGFVPIMIAVAPFCGAIFLQSVFIAAFGSGGVVTSVAMDAVTIMLGIGLFYSGLRVVFY